MKHWHYILLAALCAATLAFTRWAGLAVVLGCGLMLPRWRDRAWVILPTFLGYGAMLLLTDTWKFGGLSVNNNVVQNLLASPDATINIVGGGLAVGMLVGLVVWGRDFRLVRILVSAIVVYLAGLEVSVAAGRYHPAMLDYRLFVPISGMLFLLIIGLTMSKLPRLTSYVLAGLAYVAISGMWTNWQEYHAPGSKGLAAPWYSKSKFMLAIKQLPDTVTVYTNDQSATWLWTGRFCRAIPNSVARQDNPVMNSDSGAPARTGGYMVWWWRSRIQGYVDPMAYKSLMVISSVKYDSSTLMVEIKPEQEPQ